MKLRLAVPALLCAAATPAFAQDRPQIDPDKLSGNTVSIGVAATVTPDYEGSDDEAFSPMPLARGRLWGISFTLRGNRFTADVVPDTDGGPGWDVILGPVAQGNFNRTGKIKDSRVAALGKPGTAIELGGIAGIARQGVVTSDYDRLSATVSYATDVAGVHGSYVIQPSLDYSTPLSTKALVGLNFAATYMGGGYAQTYFGITPAGATASGLPVFTAEKGWKDWTASLVGAVSLTGDLTGGLALIGGGSYRRLLNDAADSPITSIAGSRHQWVGALGLAYTF